MAKTTIISVRCTPEQRKSINKAAARSRLLGVSLAPSTWMLAVCLQVAKKKAA